MGIHIGCCNCVERGLLRTAPTRSCLTTQQLTLFSWWLPRLLDTQVKTRQNISPSVGEHGNSSYLLLRYPTTKPIPSLGVPTSLYSTLQSCLFEAKASKFPSCYLTLSSPVARPCDTNPRVHTRAPSTATRDNIAENDSMPYLSNLELPKAVLNRSSIHVDN